MSSWKKRTRSATNPNSGGASSHKRKKTDDLFQRNEETILVPPAQSALLLHAIRQPYSVTDDHEVPLLRSESELLIKVKAVGLNPIDWKAPYVFVSSISHVGANIRKGFQLRYPCLTIYRWPRACGYSGQSTKGIKFAYQARRSCHCSLDRLP